MNRTPDRRSPGGAADDEPLRRYLDGEFELTDLPEELRGQARSWDRLLGAVRSESLPTPAPAWLEDRIMADIEVRRRPSALTRAWRWLLSPREIRVPPLGLGVAAAALAAVILVPLLRTAGTTPADETGETPVVYVQFYLEAPQARSVAVGGDFDEWRGSHALSDEDGDGVWTGRVPLRPGVHTYMFLVDGDTWETDPRAQRYADDGFGNRNAVLALTNPVT